MSLVDLIQNLVDDPQKLSEYKQDPAGYLERAGIQPANQALGPIGQIHTIMSLTIPAGGGTFQDGGEQAESESAVTSQDSGSIDLKGTWIEITSLEPTFFADVQTVQSYQLLPHSYISITEEFRYFDLHLLYLRANDPTDAPQVLYIRTQGQDTTPNPIYLTKSSVSLTVNGYVLVSNSPPVTTQLTDGSKYENGVLNLTINYSDTD